MDYIKWIREKVGHEKIFLNFSGGCVVNDNGQILLQRREDRNVWGFPGGAIELGESAEEAVIREVEEETGLKVKVEHLIGIYTKYFDEYPNGDKAQTIVCFFKLEIIGGNLSTKAKETLELKFFNPTEVPKLVNKQHEELLKDFNSNSFGVFK